MIFPSRKTAVEDRVLWLIDKCMTTREDRARLYDWREKYFLFGTGGFQPAKYNRIKSHLDLVSSFLYAPDSAFFHVAAPRNSDDDTVAKAVALQDDFNDDWTDTFMSNVVSIALDWALVYDSMIPKIGWNRARSEMFLDLVPPHNFGVYREDRQFEDQQCFCHQFFIDYQQAVEALIRAGRTEEIARLNIKHEASISPFPQMLQRMIIANTGGTNLAGNVLGQVNPDYAPMATYQPKTEAPGVMFSELWAWDDLSEDWRIFHVVNDMMVGDSKETIKEVKRQQEKSYAKDMWGTLAKSDHFSPSETNFFIPGEHPFTLIQPFPKYNYTWGEAHIDGMVQLQEWMLERLDQIADILEKQAYPPTSFLGLTGLSEEKAAAFAGGDDWVLDQTPGGKVEKHAPNMPPDIFAEFNKMEQMFLEHSGLTELLSGRGDTGIRSAQHHGRAQKTGSGRIKKTAERLKPALVRIGVLGLKLKMMHDANKIIDENGKHFRAADVSVPLKVRVDGHEYSPLFSDEAESKAVLLYRMKAMKRSMFLRLMRPPALDNLLHDARKMDQAEAQQAQLMLQIGRIPGQHSKKQS